MQASATQHRKLKTGRSVWESVRLTRIPTRRLGRDFSCDVVVIGAGISGALIAERLTDDGLDIVMIDRRGPLAGSTTASTALLQYELDVPLSRLGLQRDVARRSSLYLQGDELDAEAPREE